ELAAEGVDASSAGAGSEGLCFLRAIAIVQRRGPGSCPGIVANQARKTRGQEEDQRWDMIALDAPTPFFYYYFAGFPEYLARCTGDALLRGAAFLKDRGLCARAGGASLHHYVVHTSGKEASTCSYSPADSTRRSYSPPSTPPSRSCPSKAGRFASASGPRRQLPSYQ